VLYDALCHSTDVLLRSAPPAFKSPCRAQVGVAYVPQCLGEAHLRQDVDSYIEVDRALRVTMKPAIAFVTKPSKHLSVACAGCTPCVCLRIYDKWVRALRHPIHEL
jgi:hypothetical protein